MATWDLDPEVIHLNHGSFGACPTSRLRGETSSLPRPTETSAGIFDPLMAELRDRYKIEVPVFENYERLAEALKAEPH